LLVLSAVHFTVDLFGNALPSILPAIRTEFALRLSTGIVLTTALTIAANGIQLVSGHLRPHKTRPLFLHVGMWLAVVVCLLAALPRTSDALPAMVAMAVIAGCGIGAAHPEGLRAIHTLSSIPPAISTAVFMTGGFLGFACGGVISTALVSRFGLPGLYPLMVCPVVGVALVVLLRIRLAVESPSGDAPAGATTQATLPFVLIMIMALPAALSTTLLALLLPTRLQEVGFELTFGGYSATMFGMGGALGAFLVAPVAHKAGELRCSSIAFVLAGPLSLAYLLLLSDKRAVWLVFAAGFFAFAAYILLVTLARYARGASLGFRMGFAVGGTWLLANIIFLLISPVAERFGTNLIMQYTPVGYLVSGAFGLYLMSKRRRGTAANEA